MAALTKVGTETEAERREKSTNENCNANTLQNLGEFEDDMTNIQIMPIFKKNPVIVYVDCRVPIILNSMAGSTNSFNLSDLGHLT